MKVKGYAALAADKPLEPFEVERRDPGAKDVEIEIGHCGICHSDIHFARNEWGMTMYPCVPGHEIIGRVTRVGSAVTKHKEGDVVGVGCFIDSCRECSACQDDLENYCENGMTMTYGSLDKDGKTPTFGGYATHIVTDEHFVVKIPNGLDPAGAAPLLCAGITTWSPLRHVGVGKGDHLAVMGLGGLGHMGVKLARSLGADVTVLSRSSAKEADAEKLGATDFVLTQNPEAWGKLAGRFNYLLDTVSAKHDLAAAISTLKRDGTLIMVGASPLPLDLPVLPLIFARRRLIGSLVGGLKETQEMLDHCGEHGITSEIETTTPDQINTAYERTLAGDVKYRFVIDCSKF